MGTTSIGLAGNVFIDHPVSGYRIDRFDRTLQTLRDCDVTLANLEGCIATGDEWPAFEAGAVGSGTYMGGPPATVDEMRFMGIDGLYTANNHCADFGELGVLTTIKHLRDRQMPFAGIGASLTEASEPCYIETPGGRRVAVISLCDWGPRGPMDMLFPWPFGHMPSDELPPFRSRPGVNLLRYGGVTRVDKQTLDELRRASEYLGWEQPKALRRVGMIRDYPVIYGEDPNCEIDSDTEFYFMGRKFVLGEPPGTQTFVYQTDLQRLLKWVREARRQADIVVVGLHDQSLAQGSAVHDYIRDTAYSAVDAGADIFVNTGGLQRGVEVRDGKVIVYGLPMLYLQNDQMTRMPSSSYNYWRLDRESTVADLLDVRAERAKPKDGSPRKTQLYPLSPSALHTVIFDDDNRALEVHVQPFSVDADAPRFRRGLPLWPDDETTELMMRKTADLSEPFGTKVEVRDGVAVVQVR